ncbi:hypothetical protein M1N87_00415 [Dehalococcoidia bacterium]|nr:hypothetical protein [Dehalococcoidia bacterium]
MLAMTGKTVQRFMRLTANDYSFTYLGLVKGGNSMNISKSKLEALVTELPDEANVEEVMHRLYLLQKIEAGESAIQKGETLSHQDAMGRLSNKWQK